ncbi:hypothetical protein Dda_6464 [Drechslerella dactyloides]|uniref:C2 NT-type domain-containing protein n=1 Tax=Drechslerella dactyloides TaxID=74499 RepID=A0AAD6IUU3_DREDA|nr:hypothetical protein Dda_6464 [Drechslerella dactyloides]
MTVDRAGMLSPIYLDLEIIQEYSGRERIVLGTLELNLAEYVGRERENRRYLMQASPRKFFRESLESLWANN